MSALHDHRAQRRRLHRIWHTYFEADGQRVLEDWIPQVMTDKAMAVRRDRCGTPIGWVDSETLQAPGRVLAFVVGFADRDFDWHRPGFYPGYADLGVRILGNGVVE